MFFVLRTGKGLAEHFNKNKIACENNTNNKLIEP